MAGAKGRSGGAREGAGRKPQEKPMADNIGEVDDPLDFLRQAMNDKTLPADQRLKAAIELAKYRHGKPGGNGKKQETQKAAETASYGKYAPSAPPTKPQLRVVNS